MRDAVPARAVPGGVPVRSSPWITAEPRHERRRGVATEPVDKGDAMTEVPGTDRDQARENVAAETPLVPEDVQGAQDTDVDEDQTGDDVKPRTGTTDLGT